MPGEAQNGVGACRARRTRNTRWSPANVQHGGVYSVDPSAVRYPQLIEGDRSRASGLIYALYLIFMRGVSSCRVLPGRLIVRLVE